MSQLGFALISLHNPRKSDIVSNRPRLIFFCLSWDLFDLFFLVLKVLFLFSLFERQFWKALLSFFLSYIRSSHV